MACRGRRCGRFTPRPTPRRRSAFKKGRTEALSAAAHAHPSKHSLRERFLSIQVWPDQNAIIEGYCDVWNALAADAQRINGIALYPWIEKVIV